MLGKCKRNQNVMFLVQFNFDKCLATTKMSYSVRAFILYSHNINWKSGSKRRKLRLIYVKPGLRVKSWKRNYIVVILIVHTFVLTVIVVLFAHNCINRIYMNYKTEIFNYIAKLPLLNFWFNLKISIVLCIYKMIQTLDTLTKIVN